MKILDLINEVTINPASAQYLEVDVYVGYGEDDIQDYTIHESADDIEDFCKKLLSQRKADFFEANLPDVQDDEEREQLKQTWEDFYNYYKVVDSTLAFMAAGEENTTVIFSPGNVWFKKITKQPQQQWSDDDWNAWSELLRDVDF